jgi:HTH-type transcriptional regulator, sugar sensing transcriptional regulator
MFQDQLQKFGLTKTQSNVLDYLLEHGEAKARDIAKSINQPRGVVYKATEELLALELVEKIEKTKEVARFRATHPRALEKILEMKDRELEQNKKIFEEVLPSLVSNYNLTLNKPGVKFYEGKEGMEKILDDTLTSQTEILLFINTNSLKEEEKFKEINEAYKIKRMRKNVEKRIIRVGKKPETTFGTSDDKYDAITEIRYLEKELLAFKSDIQIYDGKISYQIIDGVNIISILIEDKNIYAMNKAWFEMLWEIAKP